MTDNIIDCMVKHRLYGRCGKQRRTGRNCKGGTGSPQLGEFATCFHSDNQGCGAEKTVQQAVRQPAAYCQSSRISDFLC